MPKEASPDGKWQFCFAEKSSGQWWPARKAAISERFSDKFQLIKFFGNIEYKFRYMSKRNILEVNSEKFDMVWQQNKEIPAFASALRESEVYGQRIESGKTVGTKRKGRYNDKSDLKRYAKNKMSLVNQEGESDSDGTITPTDIKNNTNTYSSDEGTSIASSKSIYSPSRSQLGREEQEAIRNLVNLLESDNSPKHEEIELPKHNSVVPP